MGKYLAECLEHGLNSYIYSGSMVKEFVIFKFSCSFFKKICPYPKVQDVSEL